MDDMLTTMYAAPGIGWPRPPIFQVGVTKACYRYGLARTAKPEPEIFTSNPEIL